MPRTITALLFLHVLVGSVSAQDAGNPIPPDPRPRTLLGPAQVAEAYYFVASREASPYKTVALVDTYEEGTWGGVSRELDMAARREFQRGGGIVVSTEAWKACEDDLEAPACRMFRDMIVVSTAQPFFVADTLRLPFTHTTIGGTGPCLTGGAGTATGYHYFARIDGQLMHLGRVVEVWSDSFSPEGLERLRRCDLPD